MKTIAVAGGAGNVGSTIVDGLVEYGKHKIYVLSRKDRPSQGAVNYLRVDYDDPDAIAKAFEDAGVNIVICAISVVNPEANQSQKNLIRAAEKSPITERFVISSFDMLHVKEDIELSPLARYTFEAIDELEKTQLTYTRIANGWFLDYYGMPHWKTHLEPWINVMNVEKKWAVIPGDGSVKASFITSQDMSRFVARLMDLEKWNKVSTIFANTLSFSELVEMAEKARGCKFRVANDSLEKLQSGKISFHEEFPPIGYGEGDQAFFAMLHYQAAIGRYLVPRDYPPLDAEFPDLKITTPLEVMETAWKGK
ncbi:NmrA domain-containing protein [Fusarium sp. LHS14.1]|nr:NmrA domain-containing protein [Fusarium sp. LHS14.1]